jgi:hypothetical protein
MLPQNSLLKALEANYTRLFELFNDFFSFQFEDSKPDDPS